MVAGPSHATQPLSGIACLGPRDWPQESIHRHPKGATNGVVAAKALQADAVAHPSGSARVIILTCQARL